MLEFVEAFLGASEMLKPKCVPVFLHMFWFPPRVWPSLPGGSVMFNT